MPRCLNPLRYQFSRRSINQPSPPLRIASANFYKEMAEFLEASLSGPFSGSSSTRGEGWKRLERLVKRLGKDWGKRLEKKRLDTQEKGERKDWTPKSYKRLEEKIGKDWTPTKRGKIERLDTHQGDEKIGHPRVTPKSYRGYSHGLPRMITYRLHHPRFIGGSDTKNLRIRVFSTIYG
jgi:hypothetical protein